MPVWLSALIVAIPTYLYARFVRSVDRFEKEPAKYLIAAFVWGAIPAVFLALILQLLLAVPTIAVTGELGGSAIAAVVYAPITEEIVKGLAVAFIYLWRRREFDGWVDGIVYGSTVGFGFAYVENIVYLAGVETFGDWLSLFILRVIIFGFMHGFYTSLTGIGFGLARFASSNGRKALYIGGGLLLAIVAHVIHNASLILAEATGAATLCVAGLNYALLIALMMALRPVSARIEKQMFRTYLMDEVPNVITPQAYEALCNANPKPYALPQPHDAFHHLAAELAQRKRNIIRHGEATANVEIDQLRGQLRAMSYPSVAGMAN
jgi:RsiW-degrading membrane proteinase PrsW (M82 family)